MTKIDFIKKMAKKELVQELVSTLAVGTVFLVIGCALDKKLGT